MGAKLIMKHVPEDTLRKLRSDQIGCWSVGTCAQADVTSHKGGDGFLRGVRPCDGFLHLLFFLRVHHDDGFFRPLFLATDFFVARKHASDVHQGAFVSQNHNGTDHWVRFAVQADASCQSLDTCNTIDNHNAGVSPSSSLTTSLRCN